MKLLLDECVPRKFKESLPGHDCRTVPEECLAGEKNGELLALAEKAGFQVFLTLDRGVEYQQNLRPRTNRCSYDPFEIQSVSRSVATSPRPTTIT